MTRAGKALEKAVAAYGHIVRPSIFRLDGVKLDVSSLPLRHYRSAIYRGGYERRERTVIRATLDKDDQVLEIGAGVGLVSTLCCKILGADSKVVAVEANPLLTDISAATYRLNGVAPHFYNAFVGLGNGEREFLCSNQILTSSAYKSDAGTAEPVAVAQIDLLELLQRHRASYLVMDVEGGESELLPMVAKSDVRKVCVEMHPHYVGDQKVSDAISTMLVAGFSLAIDKSIGRVLFFYRP